MPTITGTLGSDTILGTAGNDVIYGLQGNDIIDGGDGDDIIYGGPGQSILRGGAGNDTFIWTRSDWGNTIDGGSGQDTIDLSGYDSASFFTNQPLNISLGSGGIVQLIARGSERGGAAYEIAYGTAVSVERWILGSGVSLDLAGSSTNLTVISTGQFAQITTGSGNDTIQGGTAADTIRVGGGNNVVDGGGGGDTVYLDYALSASTLTVSNGVVTIISGSVTNTIRNVTHVVFTDRTVDFTAYGAIVPDGNRILNPSSGVFQGTDKTDIVFVSFGNAVLNGYGGDDFLFGGTGADRLNGGAGSDYLEGGLGVDTAIYSGLRLQYSASGTSVSGGPEGGTDTLYSIEQLQFVDGVLSFDADGAAAQVMRLYDAALDRAPDQGGLEAHTRGLASGGLTLQQLANTFVGSAEFQARYGALSNQAFVEQLYRFSLNREGDPQGISAWTAALNAGMTRGQALVGFSESGEHRTLTSSTLAAGLWIGDTTAMSVARLYDATFDRLPDTVGLTNWVAALKGELSLLALADTFAGSAEFQTRYGALSNQAFVEQLYRFCLNREGDTAGIQNWLTALNGGLSRASVLVQFSESPEHAALTAASWSGGIQYAGYTPHAPVTASEAAIAEHQAPLAIAASDQDGADLGRVQAQHSATQAEAAGFDDRFQDFGLHLTDDAFVIIPFAGVESAAAGLWPSHADTVWAAEASVAAEPVLLAVAGALDEQVNDLHFASTGSQHGGDWLF